MARKRRPESLWALLKTAANRDQVFQWLIVEGISYEACSARCLESFGFSPSVGKLRTFYKTDAFEWKIEQAKIQANNEKGLLPKDFEERYREGLAQRRFEAVFNELSEKQIIALERLELDKERLKLKAAFDTKKLQQMQERIRQKDQEIKLAIEKFQFDGAQAALDHLPALRAIAQNRTLSNDQKREQVRLRLWGPSPLELENKAP